MIRKLFKYSLILLPLFFPILVHADSTTQTFTTFNTTAESLSSSIQCNNEICVVYGVNHYNYDMNFEWGSSNTKTCTNQATVSGTLQLNNTNLGMNNNDYSWSNVYIVNNNNASDCNYQVKDTYTTFTCTTDTLGTNFKIGYSLTSRGGQYSFNSFIYRIVNITCDTSTTQIIENNNQNTQNIINNQNQNTQDIINNQNQNTQDMIDSNKVCNEYIYLGNNNIGVNNYALGDTNNNASDVSYAISKYIEINKNTQYTLSKLYGSLNSYCLYNDDKTQYSCTRYNGRSTITFTNTDYKYIRFTIYKALNTELKGNFCKNGNQALNDSINNLDDTLNDDDTSVATSEASDFFSDFTTNTFGLTSIITAPLSLIQSLLSSTCSDLQLPLPYLNNKKLILPCMSTIYTTYFGTFFTLYQTITYGIVAYWVCVRIFNLVKDFKNPEHDEIEVLDL